MQTRNLQHSPTFGLRSIFSVGVSECAHHVLARGRGKRVFPVPGTPEIYMPVRVPPFRPGSFHAIFGRFRLAKYFSRDPRFFSLSARFFAGGSTRNPPQRGMDRQMRTCMHAHPVCRAAPGGLRLADAGSCSRGPRSGTFGTRRWTGATARVSGVSPPGACAVRRPGAGGGRR